MSVLSGCKPRFEVLKGDLDDAIFAADFGDLVAGTAPKVYSEAATFFRNTHPAQPLKKTVQAVFERLANSAEPGVTIRLSTGFGGGKTHALMALWHLAENIGNASLGSELLPAAGRPKKLTTVAVDLSKPGVPVFARHGKTEVRSLWGEVFFRLGGEKALKDLGKADDPENSPSEAQIEAAMPDGPVLILLDELVIYMAKLSDRAQGNLLGFINSLTAITAKRPRTVIVVTDPGNQAAFAAQSAQLNQALLSAATKIEDMLGRRASDVDPIGIEAAKVIVRRLFESVDASAADAASATYFAMYQRVAGERPGGIPPYAASREYAQRIRECYPFHPRLLDTAQDRLGALALFNKSRGTLRLFARILRDVWESRQGVDLITAGDINFSSERIRADLLQRLDRDRFVSAVSADIEKHALELDGGARSVHQRIASAVLLESLPLESNSGLDSAEATLAALRPDEAGHEPAEALDRLVGVCWHLYPMPGGRGYQFRYEPNIVKQIDERMTRVAQEDARSRVSAEAQQYFGGPEFKLAAWPERARDVRPSADLQLALCENEKLAKLVCAYEDDTDAHAPIPRGFINAIIAVTAAPPALADAIDRAKRLLAAEEIEREVRQGESNRLARDQLQKVLPELKRRFAVQSRRAFDRVVLAGGQVFPLEEKYQVSEEQILSRPQGQACLRRFLDDKQLIYRDGDALDVQRLLSDVLPGATPLSGEPEVVTARSLHERFLSAPKLRLVPGQGVVRLSVVRAVEAGKLVVKIGERAHDAQGCVDGPAGTRRRAAHKLTSFPVDESVHITRADTETAKKWLAVDAGGGGGGVGQPPPPPPTAQRAVATTWEKAIEFAADRPLLELVLVARTASAANALPVLAQPLSADSVGLSVNVSGTLKDGGTATLAVNDVKPSHPIRPLVIAGTLANAIGDGGTFEAEFKLGFGAGRAGMQDTLRALAEAAPEEVTPRAQFDKPQGKA
jgi:hypothetical protein